MAKKTAPKTQDGENPRRPCPCGSGKRWKACHGAGDDVIVTRPFAGLAAECDLVALRELLPSATAPLPLVEPLDVPVTVASVLPGACAALVRPDGEIWLGMQVQTRSGDLSVDLARALAWAQTAEPGSSLAVVGAGRRRVRAGCRTCSTPTPRSTSPSTATSAGGSCPTTATRARRSPPPSSGPTRS